MQDGSEHSTGVVRVPLTQGYEVLIDAEDAPHVMVRKWQVLKVKKFLYAYATVDGKKVFLHRFLMNAPRGVEVDHKNGDGLDCRRSNMRLATHQQNMANQRLSVRNKSGYKGVCWFPRDSKWVAQTSHLGKHLCLGYFSDAADAARAYDRKVRELHGPFARPNFPD